VSGDGPIPVKRFPEPPEGYSNPGPFRAPFTADRSLSGTVFPNTGTVSRPGCGFHALNEVTEWHHSSSGDGRTRSADFLFRPLPENRGKCPEFSRTGTVSEKTGMVSISPGRFYDGEWWQGMVQFERGGTGFLCTAFLSWGKSWPYWRCRQNFYPALLRQPEQIRRSVIPDFLEPSPNVPQVNRPVAVYYPGS